MVSACHCLVWNFNKTIPGHFLSKDLVLYRFTFILIYLYFYQSISLQVVSNG